MPDDCGRNSLRKVVASSRVFGYRKKPWRVNLVLNLGTSDLNDGRTETTAGAD